MSNKLLKTYFLNILFYFIPVSFIAGNLILNLNILFIIIVTIVFYSNEVFKVKLNIFDKLIIFFFSYILLIALISGYSNLHSGKLTKDFTILIKTLSFFRFLILYFVIRFLINKEILNFKFFFISCAACTIFVSLDMLFQIYTGKDIFGFELNFRRASGPFGDELIAGAYLQRFSIFSLFLIFFYLKTEKQKILSSLMLLYFILVVVCIIFSGNKMPFALFLLILTLIFIFEKINRKLFLSLTIISTLIFVVLFYSNSQIKDHFGNFFTKLNQIISITEFDEESNKDRVLMNKNGKIIKDHQYYMVFADKKYEIKNSYMNDFYSGYKTWELNKYVGDGIRSYRFNCSKTDVKNCSPHPHNYQFEILAELGLFGFIILLILSLKVIYDYFYIKYFCNVRKKNDFIIIPFFYILIAEIFPIRTSGSFFSTGNATFIFLILSITIALSRKRI
tara:strand:+ start:447 stop:1793 length:1347 start_codon:yes stop_codon:yes gene_type:complete